MGHFLGMNSRVHPKYKTKYRVHNGSEYDTALVQRGEITLWISEDAIEDWKPAVDSQYRYASELLSFSVRPSIEQRPIVVPIQTKIQSRIGQ